MIPCGNCGRHMRDTEATCPHCSARHTVRRTAAAVAMGLALAACNGDGGNKSTTSFTGSVDYGGAIMDTDTDADTDADTDTDTDADSDADADSDTDTDADTDPSGDTGASSGTGRTP